MAAAADVVVRFAGLFAILAALPLAVAADTPGAEPLAGDQAGRWGRLQRVVKPEYPKEALARGQQGSVDIAGIISGSGLLDEITYRAVSPEGEAFIPALEKVAPYWMFRPAIDNRCQPK